MNPQIVMPLVIAPLMAFAVWRRVRSQFGRQPIRRKAMTVRIAIFSVLGVLLALSGLQNLRLLEGLFGGVVLGALVGLVGLRLTRFDTDAAKGDCYLPNPWLGGALTVLLLARLAWRFVVLIPQMQDPTLAGQTSHAAPGQSPLTMLVFGLLIGYYVCYYLGLLIHHRRWQAEQPSQGALPRE